MDTNPVLTLISKEAPNTYVINAHYLNPDFDIKYMVCINTNHYTYYREGIKINNIFSYYGTPISTAYPELIELEEFIYKDGYQYRSENWNIIQLLKNIVTIDKICQ